MEVTIHTAVVDQIHSPIKEKNSYKSQVKLPFKSWQQTIVLIVASV